MVPRESHYSLPHIIGRLDWLHEPASLPWRGGNAETFRPLLRWAVKATSLARGAEPCQTDLAGDGIRPIPAGVSGTPGIARPDSDAASACNSPVQRRRPLPPLRRVWGDTVVPRPAAGGRNVPCGAACGLPQFWQRDAIIMSTCASQEGVAVVPHAGMSRAAVLRAGRDAYSA